MLPGTERRRAGGEEAEDGRPAVEGVRTGELRVGDRGIAQPAQVAV